MCGIAGFVSPNKSLRKDLLKKMTDVISYRGPDGEGQWLSNNEQVGLGHRRLSIIDVSDAGKQPMHYLDRYSIVFNGEIYNYIELKDELKKKGYHFENDTDTEVIMALYDIYGISCLNKMDGMFAFALYDEHTNELVLARDRIGEKPLYYSIDPNKNLFFGSEMKVLWAGGIARVTNEKMLFNYINSNLLENPYNKKETFYKNIEKLPAAHYVKINCNEIDLKPVRYWDIDKTARNNDITLEEAKKRFKELFFESVKRRLRSDVPVGSSLSGGLDSSLIVCAIDGIDHKKEIIRKTFSAQFPGYEKDEARYQQIVIDKCHVDPYFIYPTADSMLKNLDEFMYHQEEPVGHSSICAQYEVYSLAKKHNVTVLLDGQGADEILGGYHSYFSSFFNGLKKQTPSVYSHQYNTYRTLQADNTLNVQHAKSWKKSVKKFIPNHLQEILLKSKRLTYSGASLMRPQFIRTFGEVYNRPAEFDSLNDALYFETMLSGLEILLRYGDRNSMAHSREVRLPFLYHELIEFLFSLPDTFKINEGWTKWIMRETFEDIIPKGILWRKDKIGYEPPQKEWMQNDSMKAAIKNAATILADNRIIENVKSIENLSEVMKWKVFVAANTLYK